MAKPRVWFAFVFAAFLDSFKILLFLMYNSIDLRQSEKKIIYRQTTLISALGFSAWRFEISFIKNLRVKEKLYRTGNL